MPLRRRSLAERIANSTCRKCGQPGHWRRECPLNATEKDTGVSVDEWTPIGEENDDVVTMLPEEALMYVQDGRDEHNEDPACNSCTKNFNGLHQDLNRTPIQTFESCPQVFECLSSHTSNFSNELAARLTQCCRNHCKSVPEATAVPATLGSKAMTGIGAGLQDRPTFSDASCLFNSEEADGDAIIDTGASRAVIGEEQVHGLLKSFSPELRMQVYKARTPGVVFKFGNSSKLTSQYALLLPCGKNGWIRVEVVPG